jgi:hypothetical protein
MKKYTINEVLPVLELSDYNQKKLTEVINTSEKVSQFYPSQVILNFQEEDGKEYYQYAEIKMNYKGYDFYIKYWEQKKKFIIYEDFTRKLNNVDRYALAGIKEKIQEPQQIGVLSEKKILNWFEYHLAVIQEAIKIDIEKGSEKDAFLKSIEGLPVKWWNNGKSGEIIQNGVKFSFTISETYISKKIEIYYSVPNDLESFLKLSDNQYKK